MSKVPAGQHSSVSATAARTEGAEGAGPFVDAVLFADVGIVNPTGAASITDRVGGLEEVEVAEPDAFELVRMDVVTATEEAALEEVEDEGEEDEATAAGATPTET
jgi:hypothetical protein